MDISLHVDSHHKENLGEAATKTFDHNGGSFGRASHNTWVLPDESKVVSGQHGMVFFEDEKFYLTDISTNGIYINGNNKPLGKGNVIELMDGDLLSFGDYEVRVSLVSEAVSADPGKIVDPVIEAPAIIAPVSAGKTADTENKIRPELASNTISPQIEQPNYDPLGSTSSDFAEGKGQSPGSFDSEVKPPSEVWSESQSVMNDAFNPARVTTDEGLAVSGNQLPEGEVIPEDWNLTGFSNPSQLGPNAAEKSQVPEQSPSLKAEPQRSTVQPRAPGGQDFSAADNTLFDAFMRGVGLDISTLPPDMSDSDVMETAGRLFREIVSGLMVLLQSRSELKNEFRMSATTIRPIENNPLKFTPHVEEALKTLFLNDRPGFLGSEEAIHEAIRDIHGHQVAMIAGMQSGVVSLLQRLDPGNFANSNEEGFVKAALLSVNKKSRAWEDYSKFFDENVVKSGNAFQALFAEDFCKAYDEQIRLLEAARND